ncbi:hypothetical protein [Mycolicibacterium komossense]|uniref:Uncharacterized protein n=1 Tax=Mycolicibacterium komossense TaxID=1779 RepID=A0ABT3CEY6_9MYCO|nr:hypothetical protein [Mycolicibacterium komossense]MCV7227943.1 hypothetical protein [Mycolicibacterium komossense]
MDDAGVVDTGVIDDKPTTEADQVEAPQVEQVTVSEPQTAPRRGWSMPKVTRQQTDEVARAARRVGSGIAKLLRRIGTMCAAVAGFGWQLIRQVPPALQLLGALGLCTLLSIAGSVALDDALGKTCAVVFVPGFALALGVVAHHWYLSLSTEDRTLKSGSSSAPLELRRSVEYVDSKLAFALNALGTDRQQQAVIALIQAKTATELSFGPGQEPVRPSLRPRIRAGGLTKAQPRESVSVAGLA